MVTFFERMLRTNRLNEFKGAPAYLRTHPLTTERIADIQDRVQKANPRLVPDSFEYRMARARLRARRRARPARRWCSIATCSPTRPWSAPARMSSPRAGAAPHARFRRRLEDAAPLRGASTHPAFELLAAQLQADQGRNDEALETYRAALR
jgi:predicted Zn-dependent protease